VRALAERGIKTSPPRVRKMIHAIRCEGMIVNLISTGSGYHIAESITEMDVYIKSLNERIGQIQRIRNAMVNQRDRFYQEKFGPQTTLEL